MSEIANFLVVVSVGVFAGVVYGVFHAVTSAVLEPIRIHTYIGELERLKLVWCSLPRSWSVSFCVLGGILGLFVLTLWVSPVRMGWGSLFALCGAWSVAAMITRFVFRAAKAGRLGRRVNQQEQQERRVNQQEQQERVQKA